MPIRLTKDHLKMYKVAKNDRESSLLSHIYLRRKDDETIILAASDGSSVIERVVPLDERLDDSWMDQWLSTEYAHEIYRVMLKWDQVDIFDTYAQIIRSEEVFDEFSKETYMEDRIVMTVPAPKPELELMAYPSLEQYFDARPHAHRVFINAGRLVDLIDQFTGLTGHAPAVWLEIDTIEDHINVRSEGIQAAFLPQPVVHDKYAEKPKKSPIDPNQSTLIDNQESSEEPSK